MRRVGGNVGRPPKNKPKASAADESEGGGSSSGTEDPKASGAAALSYTAPQWLLNEKQTRKFVSVPIPPIPPEVYKVAKSQLGKHVRKKRKQTTALLNKLRTLQQDQKASKQKVKAQKEKLNATLAAKDEGLDDIRRVRHEEIQEAMQELEQTLRTQHSKQYEQQEEELKEQVKEEFEEEFAKEAESKQKQLEKEEEEALREEQERLDAQPPKKLKSEELQHKIEACQTKVEKLTEKKSEMVWLLKQVIKADAKRKILQKKMKIEVKST